MRPRRRGAAFERVQMDLFADEKSCLAGVGGTTTMMAIRICLWGIEVGW